MAIHPEKMSKANNENIFFVDKVEEIEVCDGTFYYLSGSSFSRPTDFKRIKNEEHNLDTCDDCRENYNVILSSFQKRLERFPSCCVYHKELSKYKWFNTSDFIDADRLAAEKILYTWHFILKYINEPSWKEEITDYIQYIVHTFGSFPNDLGEPLFLSAYFDNLKSLLNGIKEKEYEEKKQTILQFFESYRVDKNDKPNTDFNILLGVYNEWYKTFPFDLSIFSNLKEKFSKTIPIIQKAHYNKYSEVAIAIPRTKQNLIKLLIDITDKIVTGINSLKLYEQGKLSDIESYKLELLLQKRKLQLKEGYNNNSQDKDTRYRKILKAWLSDELDFIKEMLPTLQSIESKKNNLFLDVIFACNKMQENKIFWTADENSRTKQILDLLEFNYSTKDQSQVGISTKGKKAGSVDGIIIDKKKIEHFIEALNLQSLNKEYIQMHISKLESNYDSKGLKNKFLIIYCNISDNSFESFSDKYYNHLGSEVQFTYPKKRIEKIESEYTNQRIIKTTHERESIEVVLYHVLLKMPQ